MRIVDAYLSRKVQALWPDGIVYKDEAGSNFVLERSGEEPLGLGMDFRQAKQTIEVLRNREKALRSRQAE